MTKFQVVVIISMILKFIFYQKSHLDFHIFTQFCCLDFQVSFATNIDILYGRRSFLIWNSPFLNNGGSTSRAYSKCSCLLNSDWRIHKFTNKILHVISLTSRCLLKTPRFSLNFWKLTQSIMPPKFTTIFKRSYTVGPKNDSVDSMPGRAKRCILEATSS